MHKMSVQEVSNVVDSKVVHALVGGRSVRVNALSKRADDSYVMKYSHRDFSGAQWTDFEEQEAPEFHVWTQEEYSVFRQSQSA